jgi:hypothetical protein
LILEDFPLVLSCNFEPIVDLLVFPLEVGNGKVVVLEFGGCFDVTPIDCCLQLIDSASLLLEFIILQLEG